MELAGGFFGLVILALDIWAIIHVVQSNISTGGKVIWVLGILVFQVVGFLAWLLFGPRATPRTV